MARSPAEIQADIAVTRRVIEHQLDSIQRKVPNRWWTRYAVLAGALATGFVLSRLAHFLAYARASNHETRATLWTIGSLILVVITVWTLVVAVRHL